MRKIVLTLFGYPEEEHILRINLGMHYDYVDHIVITESNHTFQGNYKGYALNDILKNSFYDQYRDKIEVVEVDPTDWFGSPTAKIGHEGNELYQREAAIWGIRGGLKPGDILYVGDIDEIVHPYIWDHALSTPGFHVNMVKCSGYLNTQVVDPNEVFWHLASVYSGAQYMKMRETMEWPMSKVRKNKFLNKMQGLGGWHFSSCFTPEQMITKYKSYCALSWNKDAQAIIQKPELIKINLDNMKTPLGNRDIILLKSDILPYYVLDNLDYYKTWMKMDDPSVQLLKGTGAWIGEFNHSLDEGFAEGIHKIIGNSTSYDFGCGWKGCYVKYINDLGGDMFGYDGNTLVTQQPNCDIFDLSVPLDITPRPWVLCAEVLEHLPMKFEDIICDSIVDSCTEGAILTWATPGQGGFGHYNERPLTYAMQKFLDRGMVLDKNMSRMISESSIKAHYRDNVFVMKKLI